MGVKEVIPELQGTKVVVNKRGYSVKEVIPELQGTKVSLPGLC